MPGPESGGFNPEEEAAQKRNDGNTGKMSRRGFLKGAAAFLGGAAAARTPVGERVIDGATEKVEEGIETSLDGVAAAKDGAEEMLSSDAEGSEPKTDDVVNPAVDQMRQTTDSAFDKIRQETDLEEPGV